MSQTKKENFREKVNIANKRHLKTEKGISSTRVDKIYLKFILIFILYNSISLTNERALEIRILENNSKIKIVIKGPSSKNFLGKKLQLVDGENSIQIENLPSSCTYMFNDWKDLIEVDLTEFDSSNINDMSFMFSGCENLKKVDISNLNTENVKDMNAMFNGCFSLTSLKLSSFITSRVTNMNHMFTNCKSLTFLDILFLFYFISNFNTKNNRHFDSMFKFCSSLSSVKLGNLDTSSTINMNSMFANCTNLTSLDIIFFFYFIIF